MVARKGKHAEAVRELLAEVERLKAANVRLNEAYERDARHSWQKERADKWEELCVERKRERDEARAIAQDKDEAWAQACAERDEERAKIEAALKIARRLKEQDQPMAGVGVLLEKALTGGRE